MAIWHPRNNGLYFYTFTLNYCIILRYLSNSVTAKSIQDEKIGREKVNI